MLLAAFVCHADGTADVDDANATPKAVFDDEFGDLESFDDFGVEGFEDEFAAEAPEPVYDPLEPCNRFMTGFNDDLFTYVLDPVLIYGYQAVLPEPARFSIRNFFDNLYYPVSLGSNLLQLKFEAAGTETLRFVINSTIGILGLFDPAREWLGIEPHVEDLGQTLGYWGVGSGFHIVLPFLGPTNLRDMSGDLLDNYINPLYYSGDRRYNLAQNRYAGWGLLTYKEFNELSLYDEEYKAVRKDALDLYPFIRDAYEMRRNKLIEE